MNKSFSLLLLSLTISLLGSWTCGASDSSGKQTGAGASTNSAGASGDAALLIDTAKLKSDINGVLNSIASGKPDTTAMKKAAADILTTDAHVLSDSGIDQLYGNSNDPAVKNAAEALKKMRNAVGISSAALDSIRHAAATLKN
jgi:hypothetical protein